MKRSHFLMIVLITIFISIGAVSCGSDDKEEAATEETTAEVDENVAVEEVVADAPAEEVVADAPAEEVVADAPAEEVVADAPADEAAADAPAEGAIGGTEGDEGVGGAAGDPTADQVAVDPNAGGAAPEVAEAATTTDESATTTEAAPSVDISNCEPPNVPVPTGSSYVVQACDNLYRIGLAYGLSWTVIAEANGIYYPDYIYIGQTLFIPSQPAE